MSSFVVFHPLSSVEGGVIFSYQKAGDYPALAQRMAYCLRAMGVIEPVGKRGGAVLYAVAR